MSDNSNIHLVAGSSPETSVSKQDPIERGSAAETAVDVPPEGQDNAPAHASKPSAYRDQQEISLEKVDPRARIVLAGKDRLMSDVAADFGHVLAAEDLYRYAGCAAVYDEKARTLLPMKSAPFRTWAERFIMPVKIDKNGEEAKHSMSSGDAGTVLASSQFLGCLREVERINPVRLPAIRSDGSLLLLPEGYDPESKILTVRRSITYSTAMPATEAADFLSGELLKDFPFADEKHSKAVSLAAMLTLFGLNLMPPRTLLPVILFRANWPGAGKGLLAQLATAPVLGSTPTGVDPKNDAEMRKHLFAVAIAGHPVFLLDNVPGRLASPSLESFITASTVTGRVLGTSTTLNLAKNTLVLVTGNNCSLNDDMARRTVISELYLEGNPAERIIEKRLDEHRILEMRPLILAALYALVREWVQAGKPAASKINPNFEVWSQTIGGIVEHAGFGAVTTTMADAGVADPNQTDMCTLVEKLHNERQAAAVTFQELVAIARTHHLFGGMLASDERQPNQINTAFGRFLKGQDQRVFRDGLRFIIISKGHSRRYALHRLEVPRAAA